MPASSHKRFGLAVVLAAAAMLTACAVGPDYRGPPPTAPLSIAAGRFHRAAGAEADPAPPPQRWWEALGDPMLTRLIDRGVAASPTVGEARARVRAARASLGETRAGRLPSGGASALEASARLPTGALGALLGSGAAGGSALSDVNLYSAGFDATWELDVFGGTRREIEAAGAQAGAREAELQDAEVELAAEIAQTYVNLRDAQARLQLAAEALTLQRETLDLIGQRRARGAAADGDLERARAGVDQAQAQIAPLEGEVQQGCDALAALTGREPGALDAQLAAAGPVPAPPAATPVGDPATLLRRRPDIRAAERRLAASNARIGQAVARLFPKVTLLGDIGFTATDAGQLFDASRFSAVGAPSLSWNIFNYPAIEAQIGGAKADRDAAAAQYQATVLQALRDAEGALSRFGHQRQSLIFLMRAEASADRGAEIVARRRQAGTASLIDVLDARRQQIEARRALAQGRAQLTDDYIALQKSLGLGWGDAQDARSPPPAPRT
jgi:NodT family efflux transporter outer membrane factor (OMF) lipoprotein